MKRVLYLNTLNIRPLPRTKQHKTTKMKTKEEIQSEAEWRFTDGHGATDQYCVKVFVSACEWMQESIQQEWIPENQKEDIKNLLFLAKEMCGIHHPFLQTELYKRLSLESPTL